MEEMGSVGRGEKRQRLVEQGVELFCEERGVLWTELVAEESFLVSCRGLLCGLQRRRVWLYEEHEKTRRQKGSLGADKKIRFQGYLCRKSRLADAKGREGRR